MDTPDEDHAVAEVVERLAAKHPDIARERIAGIVDEVHTHFAGSTVTGFIPVLVEHDAKAQLRDIEAESESELEAEPEPEAESEAESEPGNLSA